MTKARPARVVQLPGAEDAGRTSEGSNGALYSAVAFLELNGRRCKCYSRADDVPGNGLKEAKLMRIRITLGTGY